MTTLKIAIPVSAFVGRAIKASLGAACLASLVGCEVVGPASLQHGRVDYNAVIAKTNMEQTFTNILRVCKAEPTAFMEVSEVDAVVLSSASFSAGIGGIGAGLHNTTGEVGNVGGTLNYQESPTIRYQPLLGQALISQLSTPVSVDALSNLISSGWGPAEVLDLALDRLTPNPLDRPNALRAIEKLWKRDALIIVAAKRQKGENNNPNVSGFGNVTQVNNNAGATGGSGGTAAQDDSLVLYLNEKQAEAKGLMYLWNQLQNDYKDTQDTETTPWNEIVLRTKPETTAPKPGTTYRLLGPIIQIRSALGILKTAVDYHTIEIVDPNTYASWKERCGPLEDSHLLPTDTRPNEWQYLLIIRSPVPPPSLTSYVMHFDPRLAFQLDLEQQSSKRQKTNQLAPQRGEYFYVANDDDKSKKAFTLLNLFLIVQATAAPAPLTPTIPVGPGPTGG
jgi:hypothetical protein